MGSAPQRNMADLPLVTLDNNPLIALRNDEPDAPAVRALLDLNYAGLIAINVTRSTAMEAQRLTDRLEEPDLIAWLKSLGITRDNILTSWRSVGFETPGAPDTMTFDPRLELALTEHIHTILHPEMPFMWHVYRQSACENHHLTETQVQALLELETLHWGPTRIPLCPTPGLDALSNDEREGLAKFLERLNRRWFNAKNDAEGIHIHITLAWHTTHPEHSVFVTSDKRLRTETKRAALRALGYRGEILPPADAITFLCTVIEMPTSTQMGR